MPGTQELTRRITSVKSTRKVTRAMQMVSAAKMRKSQSATMSSRTYAQLAWELIRSLGVDGDTDMPLLQSYPEAAKIGIVVVSSNRGLVGSFNQNLINKAREVETENPGATIEFVVIGRKAKDSTARLKKTILAEFPKQDSVIPVEQVYPLAKLLSTAYSTGEYKKIVVIYNHFVSTLVQTPTVKQLFPLINNTEQGQTTGAETSQTREDTLYEPSPHEVLNHLIPRIIESQLYQSILESDASEHSARMVMMKNATEAAGDLIDDLTLTFNQLRQNKITTELSEITAGRIALEK